MSDQVRVNCYKCHTVEGLRDFHYADDCPFNDCPMDTLTNVILEHKDKSIDEVIKLYRLDSDLEIEVA